MTAPRTVLDADAYWERHYNEEFRFGHGTEHILAELRRLPPAVSWADLGSGSESLLWATALRARELTAVDIDPRRLAILAEFAAAARPRPAHRTALALSRRTEQGAFAARCRWLTATVTADCLTGRPLSHPALGQRFDLLTQFGLLGLTRGPEHLVRCFTAAHQLLAPGGWAAGANWEAADLTGRVRLSDTLLSYAAARCGLTLTTVRRVPSADRQFPAVWLYTGRRTHP
ncbi:hypothetical protein RM844_15260 [Streptomyces sp. DSM 44915]|uniref:Class I SAM-dependent methyltransferase n=1 Tax=Streptomyces chisholmiae TaxID=3075540 RepID=A0ABU2JRP3_9ACTN|nr:hypothetical protein [Streptomyces sp. DSM 44915]MDT0267645.1 hypothetical protein [Streptomyces sp. DSM 44915]